jgi:CO/xanthine dehydrogenase FAD-binding subunit
VLYELPSVEHVNVTSIREAVSCLEKYGVKARVIAGGTDLLGLMKDRVEGPEMHVPEVLINVKAISEINRMSYDEKAGLKIGSAVTLSRLETSDVNPG